MPVVLLLAACASSPPEGIGETADAATVAARDRRPRQDGAATADSSRWVRMKLDGALPLFQSTGSDDRSLVASNFSVGIDDLLRYQATYSLKSGDVLGSDSAQLRSPTRFGGQQLGQNIRLRLPKLGGTPVSLGLSTEFRNDWMLSGLTQVQREVANLNWAPGQATVNVQWAGAATAFDPSLALSCDLESTVRFQTHAGSNHSEAVRISGRDCVVAADDTPLSGIEAQIWGLGYVWSRSQRESEAVLSVIDPVWARGVDRQQIEPGYEFGLRHRRSFGALSAMAFVSLRQASIRDIGAPVDPAGSYVSAIDTNWAADASLTWDLPRASLSAKWATGVDRLWFTPDIGQRSDRFGLAVNLSRWLKRLAPESSPQLAMNWKWSQLYLPGDEITGNNSLRLDLALLF